MFKWSKSGLRDERGNGPCRAERGVRGQTTPKHKKPGPAVSAAGAATADPHRTLLVRLRLPFWGDNLWEKNKAAIKRKGNLTAGSKIRPISPQRVPEVTEPSGQALPGPRWRSLDFTWTTLGSESRVQSNNWTNHVFKVTLAALWKTWDVLL